MLVVRDSNGIPSPSNIGRQGQGPSNFPTPPSVGRPSRNVPGVNSDRIATKVVTGVGAVTNSTGGGGNAKFDDDTWPALNKEQSQESKTYDYNYQSKKKKQSAEQCELDENVKDAKVEIVYSIKAHPALVREAKQAGRDQSAQRSINNLVEQLSLGNRNPGIGTEDVFKDVYELRGKNRARVYYREVGGKIEILGKSTKSNKYFKNNVWLILC